jgi:carotenoid 1,2-hydratase
VFSPYYLKARQSGPVDPHNHCAINVALYGKQRRWAMTERRSDMLERSANTFRVGPSDMQWRDGALVINIEETCAWLPFKLRGQIVMETPYFSNSPVLLSQKGAHYWRAVAPEARVTVSFKQPDMQWSGQAYCDTNWGDEPLEKGFRKWTWLRAHTQRGTCVIYDAERRDGSMMCFSHMLGERGMDVSKIPEPHDLPKGFWRMPHAVRSEGKARLVSRFEDTPFYTRNKVQLILNGEACEGVHECLSLDRFVHPITQRMLPYKMPRV